MQISQWRVALLSLLITGFFVSLGHSQETKRKRLVLIGQGPDGGHPPETHEYFPGMRVLQKSLRDVSELDTVLVRADGDWADGPEILKGADGAVLFVAEGAKWIQADPRRYEAFVQHATRGGGLIVLHWGMGAKSAEHIAGFRRLFGGCHGGPDRKYKVLETDFTPVDTSHPITQGIPKITVMDEFYYSLKFEPSERKVQPLVTTTIGGQSETVAWAWERPDGGRSFGFSGLHFHANWKRPEYRQLISRAALWSVKLPIPDRNFPTDLVESDFSTVER